MGSKVITRYITLAIPICFGLWTVWRLNRFLREEPDRIPMTPERRRLLIRAERDQDEMLGIGS